MAEVLQRRRFGLLEWLVALTVVGAIVAAAATAVGPLERASRDRSRLADATTFIQALDAFKSNYGIYPNYTYYLGDFSAGGAAEKSRYGLAVEVSQCNGAPLGSTSAFLNLNGQTLATADQPTVDELNTLPLTLKPGFVSVNAFLICLGYLNQQLRDPIFVGTSAYQYRVGYDYQTYLVATRYEGPGGEKTASSRSLFADGYQYPDYWQFHSNGGNALRLLDDDTDVSGKFFTLSGLSGQLGDYLYQCRLDGKGAVISEDKRATVAPLVADDDKFTANVGSSDATCKDGVEASTVAVGSY